MTHSDPSLGQEGAGSAQPACTIDLRERPVHGMQQPAGKAILQEHNSSETRLVLRWICTAQLWSGRQGTIRTSCDPCSTPFLRFYDHQKRERQHQYLVATENKKNGDRGGLKLSKVLSPGSRTGAGADVGAGRNWGALPPNKLELLNARADV